MDILETIVAKKKMDVATKKELYPIQLLEQRELFEKKCLSLVDNLNDKSNSGIIAEFKRKSPSKGVINDSATIKEVLEAYSKYAAGVSVLTDEYFFGGSDKDLIEANQFKIPLLRKDFIVDEYQIIEAKSIGADVILLIAACLTPTQVKQFATLAKELGMEVLLEIHDENELIHICDEISMVGVNNRNLKSFEVDINISLNLIHQLPQGKPAVAESGISVANTVHILKQAGYKGFLMGEYFMKTQQPGRAFINFVEQINQLTAIKG